MNMDEQRIETAGLTSQRLVWPFRGVKGHIHTRKTGMPLATAIALVALRTAKVGCW